MNLAPLSALSMPVADIIPPPPPNGVPAHLAGSGLASLGFWMIAVVAVAALWWMRRRRSSVAMRDAGPGQK